jgi:multidrug transporter EmrE-like cation transporter
VGGKARDRLRYAPSNSRRDRIGALVCRRLTAMSAGTLSLILVSVSLSALAQVSLKFGVGGATSVGDNKGSAITAMAHAFLTPGVFGGLALYGLGMLLWLTVLRRIDVSQAYPFIGLGIALTSVLGYGLFGEMLGPQRIIGMLVVIGGIIVVAWS